MNAETQKPPVNVIFRGGPPAPPLYVDNLPPTLRLPKEWGVTGDDAVYCLYEFTGDTEILDGYDVMVYRYRNDVIGQSAE